jgi:hypothetical protein
VNQLYPRRKRRGEDACHQRLRDAENMSSPIKELEFLMGTE